MEAYVSPVVYVGPFLFNTLKTGLAVRIVRILFLFVLVLPYISRISKFQALCIRILLSSLCHLYHIISRFHLVYIKSIFLHKLLDVSLYLRVRKWCLKIYWESKYLWQFNICNVILCRYIMYEISYQMLYYKYHQNHGHPIQADI